MKFTLKSNAKINIGLNVLEKRQDGYHNLEMIMSPINLFDILEITSFKTYGKLLITSNNPLIPKDENNIIYKVYNKFYKMSGLNKTKLNVHLIKNIPFAAGLGGGSGNGAFFLKWLNEYHENFFTEEELINFSKTVGADIPFFLVNKSAKVKGIGDRIEIIENNLKCDLLLIKPEIGISAKTAYSEISNIKEKKEANIDKIVDCLFDNNLLEINNYIENTLHQAIFKSNLKLKEFEITLKKIEKEFNIKFFMSGSGSCYFALLNRENSNITYQKVRNKYKGFFISLNYFLH